eukprot:7384575-Prymnesium_polylepis.1
MDRDALTTSGTSMKAATAPVTDGHCAHATSATSPQKYCGSGWTTSWSVPLTATDLCVELSSSSEAGSGSLVPSPYSSTACTLAASPSWVSDCWIEADADCGDAALNVRAVTADASSCAPLTSPLCAVICARLAPATDTLAAPAVLGRTVRSAALYCSPTPLTAAMAVTSIPSARTRTAAL